MNKYTYSLWFFFLLSLLHPAAARAQQMLNSDSLLWTQDFKVHTYDSRKPSFLFAGHKNVVLKYNPVSLVFGGLLYFYQKAISPQISAQCPYEINCSSFSKQCIQHYGLLKGISLTADRLTRCTQYTVIDLLPSQLNGAKKIIDPVEQYTFKHAH